MTKIQFWNWKYDLVLSSFKVGKNHYNNFSYHAENISLIVVYNILIKLVQWRRLFM